MDIAMLGFRLVGGLVFAAHSGQKPSGVFVEQIGLRPDELGAWYPAAAA
jgi:hypothetical protein